MPRRLRHFLTYRGGLLILILLFPAVIVLTFYQSTSPPAFVRDHPYFLYDLDTQEPRDGDNQRCVLPRIHPFDPSIWGYLSPNKKIVCAARKGELTSVDEDGRLKFNETELSASGYDVGKSLNCFWSKVERDVKSEKIDDFVGYSQEVSTLNS